MRKRSKYRPKGIIANPVAYVLESLVPVAKHESYLIDLKIKNSGAMNALLRGAATRDDMDALIAMSNITEALYKLGFGQEYGEVCIGGREAIIAITHRAVQHGRFVPTGPEIIKLNLLMELHDAQMDVITIKDMERALAYARQQFASKKGVTYLPKVEEIK
jgi:hypothetical protein